MRLDGYVEFCQHAGNRKCVTLVLKGGQLRVYSATRLEHAIAREKALAGPGAEIYQVHLDDGAVLKLVLGYEYKKLEEV